MRQFKKTARVELVKEVVRNGESSVVLQNVGNDQDRWDMPKDTFEDTYSEVDKDTMIDESLFSVSVIKDSTTNVWSCKFKVHSENGTVNEFTFGTNEQDARDKVNHLVQNILLGLEYVQNEVREAYSGD